MINTPEEKLEHLFDEFIWAWYNTCLPSDRQHARRLAIVPPLVDDLLTSRRIAELILTRFDEAVMAKRCCLRGLALRYRNSRPQARMDASNPYGRTWLSRDEVREIKEESFQFQLRTLLLPESVEALQILLQIQVMWMYAYFTPSEQAFLAEIAVWHAEQMAAQRPNAVQPVETSPHGEMA